MARERVLIAVTVASTTYAGSAVQMIDLASCLRRWGWKSIVALTLKPSSVESKRFANGVIVDGVEVKAVPLPALDSLVSLVERHRDVTVLGHIGVMPALRETITRGVSPVFVYNGITSRLESGVLASLCIPSVRGIVSIADACQASLLEQAGAAALPPLVVIPPSTVLRFSQRESARAQAFQHTLNAAPVIATVGAVRPYKRVDRFVDVVDRLGGNDGAIGVVVGPFTKAQIAALAARQHTVLDERGGIVYCGRTAFVGPSDAPGSWLRCAHLLLSMSDDEEGVSGAVREAATMGLPVVVTPVGGTAAWLAERGELAWSVANDVASAASKVTELLQGPKPSKSDSRRRLGVEQGWRWKRAQQYERLFTDWGNR